MSQRSDTPSLLEQLRTKIRACVDADNREYATPSGSGLDAAIQDKIGAGIDLDDFVMEHGEDLILALSASSEKRPCTCAPEDVPGPCQHKYAASECIAAARSARNTIIEEAAKTAGAMFVTLYADNSRDYSMLEVGRKVSEAIRALKSASTDGEVAK